MEKFPLQRLGDVLTRVDELLVMLLKVEEEQLKLLQAIAPVPARPPGAEVAISIESILELVKELTTRLSQLPNRLKRVELDTSISDWKSLRAEEKIKPRILLGFWVEDVGGGFEYQIAREGFESEPRTAEVDDKWEMEFDDLLVKGAGDGKAYIWYWWRE